MHDARRAGLLMSITLFTFCDGKVTAPDKFLLGCAPYPRERRFTMRVTTFAGRLINFAHQCDRGRGHGARRPPAGFICRWAGGWRKQGGRDKTLHHGSKDSSATSGFRLPSSALSLSTSVIHA